jgi:chitinase
LLIVLMVVLALGVLGVIYLLSRPSAKSPAGANVTVTILPAEADVPVGEAHDFSATVTGSGDTDVTWSVAEGSAGGTVVNRGAQAQGGAVASLGVYVAPTTPGTYHVVATSKANPSKSATAEVLVSGK